MCVTVGWPGLYGSLLAMGVGAVPGAVTGSWESVLYAGLLCTA